MSEPVVTGAGIARLLTIMSRLRDPAGGCPWDLEQDAASLAPYALEEAYEVVDAIEAGDSVALCEELGDLLFQVVFHAQLATEQADFTFDDVVEGICEKMTRRHPHVFGDAEVADAAAQTEAWERHKQREQAHRGALDGVPPAMPALTRADKLQRRAARVGFDWPQIDPVFAKVEEELGEVRAAAALADDRAALEEECGDLLFAVVNLVRHAGFDPESTLRKSNRKFVARFTDVEAQCRADGRDMAATDIDTLERYWEVAKRRLASPA